MRRFTLLVAVLVASLSAAMVLHQPDPGRGRAQAVTTRTERTNDVAARLEAAASPTAAEEAGDAAETPSNEQSAEASSEEQQSSSEQQAQSAPPQSAPQPPPINNSSGIRRLRVSQVGIDANV